MKRESSWVATTPQSWADDAPLGERAEPGREPIPGANSPSHQGSSRFASHTTAT